MAKTNKPLIWALFAAGGTLAAFLLPAIVFSLTIGVALNGIQPESLAYDRVIVGLQSPFAKLVVFGTLVVILWHAAHRMRITAHDLGIYADSFVMTVCYGIAAVGSVIVFVVLIGLR